jgi:catechol 2,3-dioxygenase-like lactoylglutathione lyase family enzyme
LISVADEAEALASGGGGAALVEFLRDHEGGLLGYALATTAIEEDAARFRDTGLAAEGPFAMSRQRPDGHRLAWRLLVPGGVSWRRRWPFLIDWETPDETRLAWEQPGEQPNGVTGVAGIALAVRDLDSAIDLYTRQLGLPAGRQDEVAELGAHRATFAVGAFQIALLASAGAGTIQRALDEQGEGPWELRLTVADLERARAALAAHSIAGEPVPGEQAALRIPTGAALGANLVLSAPRAS